MDVLITGSRGFLGKTMSLILKKNHSVFELPTLNSGHSIRLEKDVPEFSQSFEMVVHVAGKAHSVPKGESEKLEFHNVNVVGTQNLLEGLTNSGLPKFFIFISSVAVYGKDFGSEIDESAALGAIDPYGKSKIEAERIIFNWCKNNHVICTILRLPLIIGPNPPGNLGAMVKSIKKGYYFNVAGGKANKSMVLAEDVANALLNVAQVGGIYNLTDGYNPSFAELSNHISEQLSKGKPMNVPLFIAKIAAKFGDLIGNKAPLNSAKLAKITSDLTFNDTKARLAFGWDPKPVLKCNWIDK